MSKLIAMVATAVLVDGVRTVIQPGEELPELNKHDKGELLASGAAQDPATVAAAEKVVAKEAAEAAAHIEAARKRVQAEAASTAPPASETAASTTPPAPKSAVSTAPPAPKSAKASK